MLRPQNRRLLLLAALRDDRSSHVEPGGRSAGRRGAPRGGGGPFDPERGLIYASDIRSRLWIIADRTGDTRPLDVPQAPR